MALSEHQACGLEYLELVTVLLQRARRANPTGGVWEAADLQWWWRRDQHPDPAGQTFWLIDDAPVAAVVLTNWGGKWGCDLMSADHDLSNVLQILWPRALRQIDALCDQSVEMIVGDDDLPLIDAVTRAGFEATDEAGVTTWMSAAERPEVNPLTDGFELAARSDLPTRPHHMIRRSGEQVAERLGECSLYRPELDLAVYGPNGELAAYGLFWADPTTKVGLVEPMRTEARYQRMGLGRLVLTEGLERLATLGCSLFKVSYIVGNEASRRLYLGAGFRPHSATRTYRRRADLGDAHEKAVARGALSEMGGGMIDAGALRSAQTLGRPRRPWNEGSSWRSRNSDHYSERTTGFQPATSTLARALDLSSVVRLRSS